MAELVIDRYFSDEYPELLREISTALFLELAELQAVKNLGHDELARIAYSVTEHVRQELGGTSHYIPRGAYDLSARDKEMFDKFRGDYGALAREYHMSEMRIRQIIERYRRAELKRRQQDLFAGNTAESGK